MPRKIDTAVIEYVPDFSAVTRDTDRVLGQIFRGVERMAEDSTKNVEDSFTDTETKIDQVFEEIARSSDENFGEVAANAGRAANEVGSDFQRSGEVAEASFSELRRSANQDLDRISRDAQQAAGRSAQSFNAMAAIGGAALLGVGAAGASGLGLLAAFGLSSAASLEQTQISFNALLGSVEEGQRVFKELQLFAAETPFEFPEVAEAAKRFLAFNESIGLADSELQNYLTTLGDIASVTGAGAEGMNRIGFALGQIGSRGKVALEEINQISEAIPGFSALSAIAEHLGVTTAEAMDMISAGAVDAVTGTQAILQGMREFPGAAGAMTAQAETLMGVFSTFKDVVSQALADSFAPVIPEIKDMLGELTPVIGDALKTLAPSLGGFISDIMPLIGQLVEGLTPAITPLLDALGPSLALLGPSLVPLGEALGEVFVTLGPILPVLAEFIGVTAQLAIPVLKLLAVVLTPLTPVFELMSDSIGELGKALSMIDWGEVGRDIGGGFADAWDAVVEFFDGIGEFFSNLPDEISEFIKSIPDLLSNTIEDMFDGAMIALGVGLGLLIYAITQLPGDVIEAIIPLAGMLGEFFADLWSDTKTDVSTTFNDIVEFIAALPSRALAALTSLPGVISEFFTNAFNRGRSIVRNVINDIVKFISDLPRRLSSFSNNIGQSIVNFIKTFLNRAIDGVNQGLAKVDEIVPGDLPRIPRLAHGGIAYGPALIGEDSRTTPEAAIPLGDASAMAMLREGLGTGESSVNFAPGAVVVNVYGGMNEAQASAIGKRVGENIANVLRAQQIRTGVRVA